MNEIRYFSMFTGVGGFDGLNLSDTQKYKMMGNAVTTKVISAIATKLRLIGDS